MVVINPLLGLDVPIKVQPVSINTKDYGKQTWHWASPCRSFDFLLTRCGFCTLTFALVINVIIKTLTRVLSSVAPKT